MMGGAVVGKALGANPFEGNVIGKLAVGNLGFDPTAPFRQGTPIDATKTTAIQTTPATRTAGPGNLMSGGSRTVSTGVLQNLAANYAKETDRNNNIELVNVLWAKAGQRAAQEVTTTGNQIKAVTSIDQVKVIDNNFKVIAKQMTILASYISRSDQRFFDMQKAIQRNFKEQAKIDIQNERATAKYMDTKFATYDANMRKFDNKIETQNRKITDIMTEIGALKRRPAGGGGGAKSPILSSLENKTKKQAFDASGLDDYIKHRIEEEMAKKAGKSVLDLFSGGPGPISKMISIIMQLNAIHDKADLDKFMKGNKEQVDKWEKAIEPYMPRTWIHNFFHPDKDKERREKVSP